jgi:hypothetical protein
MSHSFCYHILRPCGPPVRIGKDFLRKPTLTAEWPPIRRPPRRAFEGSGERMHSVEIRVLGLPERPSARFLDLPAWVVAGESRLGKIEGVTLPTP